MRLCFDMAGVLNFIGLTLLADARDRLMWSSVASWPGTRYD